MSKPIQGYVRADVPLNVLGTSVQKSSTTPWQGFWRFRQKMACFVSR